MSKKKSPSFDIMKKIIAKLKKKGVKNNANKEF